MTHMVTKRHTHAQYMLKRHSKQYAVISPRNEEDFQYKESSHVYNSYESQRKRQILKPYLKPRQKKRKKLIVSHKRNMKTKKKQRNMKKRAKTRKKRKIKKKNKNRTRSRNPNPNPNPNLPTNTLPYLATPHLGYIFPY